MSTYETVFGSLEDYTKGTLEIINDNPKHYVFSNVFEVAGKAKPYERIVVAQNMEYVIETLRAEGRSPWFAAAHDEFVIVMDGEVRIDLVKLDDPRQRVPAGHQGAVNLSEHPRGRKMGYLICRRGHQALLPAGSAYCYTASRPGVLLMQTVAGELSQHRWSEICYQ